MASHEEYLSRLTALAPGTGARFDQAAAALDDEFGEVMFCDDPGCVVHESIRAVAFMVLEHLMEAVQSATGPIDVEAVIAGTVDRGDAMERAAKGAIAGTTELAAFGAWLSLRTERLKEGGTG